MTNYFPKNLKVLRKRYGYTQETLSVKVDKSKQTIAGYETGKKTPSMDTLEKYALIFNVPVDSLIFSDCDKDVLELYKNNLNETSDEYYLDLISRSKFIYESQNK